MLTNKIANDLPNKIILTIQSAGKGLWRLGISTNDSRFIFKKRGVRVWVIIGKDKFECFTACGPSDEMGNWIKINPNSTKSIRKKGYDLNKKAMSPILGKLAKEINEYSKRLDFELGKTEDGFFVKFLKFSSSCKI